MSNVSKGSCVDKHGRALKRLQQVGPDGVLEQHGEGSTGTLEEGQRQSVADMTTLEVGLVALQS